MSFQITAANVPVQEPPGVRAPAREFAPKISYAAAKRWGACPNIRPRMAVLYEATRLCRANSAVYAIAMHTVSVLQV